MAGDRRHLTERAALVSVHVQPYGAGRMRLTSISLSTIELSSAPGDRDKPERAGIRGH